MRRAAIIPAAGSGRRMGGVEKQFLILGDSPVLVHTLRKIEKSGLVDLLVLAVPQGKEESCRKDILEKYGFSLEAEVVAGGAERQNSVYNALQACGQCSLVMVHDAVRPFLTNKMMNRAFEEAEEGGAAVTAVPVKDTIKEGDKTGRVVKTVNRENLWQIQTPQIFRREILEKSFKRALKEGWKGTDEATLVEKAGYPVSIVPGSDFNIKITTREDLVLARAILEERAREED